MPFREGPTISVFPEMAAKVLKTQPSFGEFRTYLSQLRGTTADS